MTRDCRRCDAPLESEVGRMASGLLLEVLACRCGYEEPAPRVPLTLAEIRRRIATVRGGEPS